MICGRNGCPGLLASCRTNSALGRRWPALGRNSPRLADDVWAVRDSFAMVASMKTFMKSGSFRAFAWLSLLSVEVLLAQAGQDERFTIMLGGSMTGTGDLEYRGNGSGEVETFRYQIEGSYEIPLNDRWIFEVGGEYERMEADHDMQNSPVPENLSKIALTLGAYRKIDDHWGISAALAPGLYGDDEVDSSDALNVPFRLMGHWNKSEDLSVIFGFRVDTFSDSELMPILMVNWEISPQWELIAGVPRTVVTYQWNDNLNLYGGVDFAVGGSYAVDDENVVSPRRGRSLRDTYVTESEIRAMIGVDYRLDSGVRLKFEAGYAFDRSFDYHERDVELEMDSASFAGLSVSYAF